VIALLLQNPQVQTLTSKIAAGFLSRSLDMKISIGEIYFQLPGKFHLKDLAAYDNRQEKMVQVDGFDLGISAINWPDNTISIGTFKMEGVDFLVKKYTAEEPVNFLKLINHFSSGQKDTLRPVKESEPWNILVRDFSLRNAHFAYENKPESESTLAINFQDIELLDMDIIASDILITGDTISADFQNIAFIEKSGFELKEFSGSATFSPVGLTVNNLLIATNKSRLDLDLEFKYESLAAFSDFITDVKFTGNFRNTKVEMSDIGYFAETMFSMTDLIELDGLFSGTVDNLRGKDFSMRYGQHTRFEGSVNMNGLPNITETFIHADIDRFTSHAGDVQSFALPDSAAPIPVPELITNLGVVEIKGKFTGFYNDFLSNALFKTELGQLKTDIVLITDKEKNLLSYSGDLIATNLDAGRLLSIDPQLGKTSFVLEVEGSGVTLKSLDLTASGLIKSIYFNHYDYQNVTVDGTFKDLVFEGHTGVKDENLDFTFNGLIDFEEEKPRFDFHSRINHANLTNLRLANRDSVSILSTKMNFDFYATSIDDVRGSVTFDSTQYTEGSETYYMESLILKSRQIDDTKKGLSLFSDFTDITVDGNYTISNIVASLKNFIHSYSPNLAKKINVPENNTAEQSLQLVVQLKDTRPVTSLFVPQLEVAPGASITGRINLHENTAEITASSDWISLSEIRFNEWLLHTSSDLSNFNTVMKFENVILREPSKTDSIGVGIDSLRILTDFHHDSLLFRIRWNDLSNQNKINGNVSGYTYIGNGNYFEAGFTEAKMLFDSINWTVSRGNKITSDSAGLFFSGLDFMSDSSMFSVDGGISHSPLDSLALQFKKLNFSNLDQLIYNNKFDFDGVIDGNIKLVNLYKNPNFISDLQLNELSVNQEYLDQMILKTNWSDSLSKLAVDIEVLKKRDTGISRVFTVGGDYFPSDTLRNFDLDVQLDKLGIQIFNPFLDEYAHIDEASMASGKLLFSGNYERPVLTGKLNLSETQVLIKYLNTLYTATGSVEFTEKSINVNGLQIFDTRQNPAICSGMIYHDYFNDFNFDVSIAHTNLNALNTSFRDNELFYGEAYASGVLNITGPFDDILMDIKATTENGTAVTIPISSTVSVSESDFIIFINNTDTVVEEQPNYNLNLKGFSMNMELDVTPDAEIDIFLPYGMGDISGKGTGNIGLAVNPVGDFTINGDYSISSGKFNFNFEKLVKRTFDIREGSKITWEGDPYDANVNITATYNAEPSLAGLKLQTDSTAIRNKRINVDCNIHLKNSLFNPDITFSIDLTNVDNDTREIIFAALDTTNQSEMSQQILSLILIGSFSYASAGPNIGATGFKLLSNQIGNWLSRISKDFDIGINYQPGTELTEDELEVALRTQLFNDRLLIDGNFGVRGTSESQNTSNVVGDINVEYQITEDGRFRIKAFNRTNDISFLEDNAPYTQGVGIFYRKEFETFRDLFKRNKDKKKKKSENKPNQQAVRLEDKNTE
jgi:hypothetical protein